MAATGSERASARRRPEPERQPRLSSRGWARWAWRQITSMRTALFLLLLLAVAAVPGSVFPQRSLDAGRVADYLADHPSTGPWLDRLSMFDVYTSPWFSAIYLLLVVSLLGCIVPRTSQHLRDLRGQPPRAPAHPSRLPVGERWELAGGGPAEIDAVLAAGTQALRARHFKVVSHDDRSVSAESGFLRETGNLVFHIGLCAIIVGVAIGHLFGWRGDVIVPEGQAFASTRISYDTLSVGPLVNLDTIPPFSVTVDRFTATFEDKIPSQLGAAREFTAYTSVVDTPGGPARAEELSVNHPFAVSSATVFLLGNGYAPVITVRDAAGTVLYSQATPFLAKDNLYTSTGAVKVASARPSQLGFSGVFTPTADPTWRDGPRSLFPDLRNPELALAVWEGELYPGGRPQNVYTLNTANMTQVTGSDGAPVVLRLQPGQTVQLPGNRGSVTFDKVVRFAGLSVRHDPTTMFVMVSSLVTLAGLLATLLVRRRRVFVRVTAPATTEGVGSAGSTGGLTVEVGGLAKTADHGLVSLVTATGEAIRDRLSGPGGDAPSHREGKGTS